MLFYLAVYVLQHWTASASSYMVVLVPFVTVPLAALLAEEEITVWLLAGALLVLLGAFVGALSDGTKQQERLDTS